MPKRLLQPDTSLYAYLAREAPIGVILRRGPSKHVQMIRWDTKDDTFEEGQWFKGRIYERRCDLSPGGKYFLYFAATYKEPLRSWTAISKPPWFTALALWLKGDGWNGGGYFLGSHTIHLNHHPSQAEPHLDFTNACRKFGIQSYAERQGEDSPVWDAILRRDGWQFVQHASWSEYEECKGMIGKVAQPLVWRKKGPATKLLLEMAIEGIGRLRNRWYRVHYRLLDEKLSRKEDLGILDWADWDKQSDLLYARQGKLFRQKFRNKRPTECREIADFTANRFKAIKAPDSAKEL